MVQGPEDVSRLGGVEELWATSIPALAEEAGVALKTIYVYFETKGRARDALWDASRSDGS